MSTVLGTLSHGENAATNPCEITYVLKQLFCLNC